MNTNSTVRMKVGPVEFECTATEDFLRVELPALIAGLTRAYRENLSGLRAPDELLPPNGNGGEPAAADTVAVTTTSIAAKLKVKTGPELVLASALRLSRMGKVTFTRSEIVERMREATAYFKQTYINNLSKYINSLVAAGKLLENAKHTYALSGATKSELEARLAQP